MDSRFRLLSLGLILAILTSLYPIAGAEPLEPSVDAPTLVSPEDGEQTTGNSYPPLGVPTLQWMPVDDAARYTVQVSASAGFASPIVTKDTYATSYTPELALADGVWYWRVRAQVGGVWGPYSNARWFGKDWNDQGTMAPLLISPADGASRHAFAGDDFSWTTVPGAAKYRLQISADPGFSSLTYSATTLLPRHIPTQRLANNLYYWRVIPIDQEEHSGAPSQTASFTFSYDLAPVLLSPENNVEPVFLPRFSWSAVEAAMSYRLEISTQPDFSTSVNAYVTDHTDFTPELNLANDQDYYWRVRALDHGIRYGPWSEVRRFRMRWNYETPLFTPLNNQARVSYPYFDWQPIPAAQRYQIQIDESTSFSSPIADEEIYNTTSWAQPEWRNVIIDGDYYWRVRGIDARGNRTPWSELRSFQPSYRASPSLIYPLYYYQPDAAGLPVHSDRTIAWPLFVWDTGHVYPDGLPVLVPDFYELTVDDDPAFGSPNFQVTTSGNGAAPTQAAPFSGLQSGQLYFWRVRAYRGGAPFSADATSVFRYHASGAQPPAVSDPLPLFPRDAFEAVGAPPVLGWQPIAGAVAYRVQISRSSDFSEIVDEAVAQSIYYVPWQGRVDPMPPGAYWWRLRREPDGAWSAARRFNLSTDLVAGNPYDIVPPDAPGSLLGTEGNYDPALTRAAASAPESLGAYDLGALHVMLDRTYTPTGYKWVFAFTSTATGADALRYGIYFDTDHVSGSGAPGDPTGKPISADALYRPEYVLYIHRAAGNVLDPAQAFFYRWNGASWDPPQSLASIEGSLWYDPAQAAIQVLLPYTAIGPESPGAAGSVALTAFSTTASAADGAIDAIPDQPGAAFTRPAFVSDMLMPLYPFDAPLSNPYVLNDMPATRWRMPYHDSVDGYQVQVARDAAFTQLVETWESYESLTWSFFGLIPAAFRSQRAYEDNESYYWRVRIRHERYTSDSTRYDYGPWSPAYRFKLEARRTQNVAPPNGATVRTTPTFTWDRMEGDGSYQIQVDDDANFSSPLINKTVEGASHSPTSALRDGAWYWRVAMRRSSTVLGGWSPTMTFVKESGAPTPLSPINGLVVNSQPTFRWETFIVNEPDYRTAAPRYRVQLDDDPNFGSPATFTTESASYALRATESLADGTWYWRVAVLDANGQPGLSSAAQSFYKEYLPPTLLSPPQGAVVPAIPSFEWTPRDGAAYYRIQIADNDLFNSPTTATTDNTRFTPTTNLAGREYYWRVQMVDDDGKPGPYRAGRVAIGDAHKIFVPLVRK